NHSLLRKFSGRTGPDLLYVPSKRQSTPSLAIAIIQLTSAAPFQIPQTPDGPAILSATTADLSTIVCAYLYMSRHMPHPPALPFTSLRWSPPAVKRSLERKTRHGIAAAT